jgi:hypothetical protein
MAGAPLSASVRRHLRSMTRVATRWILLPFAVIAGFVLAGLVAERLAIAIGVWTYPVIGFCAASAVVGVAYIIAPTSKLTAAFASYLAGSVLAYKALKDRYDPRTYEPTLMPLWITLAGGAITLVVVSVHNFGKKPAPSKTSLERTREE